MGSRGKTVSNRVKVYSGSTWKLYIYRLKLSKILRIKYSGGVFWRRKKRKKKEEEEERICLSMYKKI